MHWLVAQHQHFTLVGWLLLSVIGLVASLNEHETLRGGQLGSRTAHKQSYTERGWGKKAMQAPNKGCHTYRVMYEVNMGHCRHSTERLRQLFLSRTDPCPSSR